MDYSKISALHSIDAKIQETEKQMLNQKYISLTDALANYKGGGALVFEALADQQSRAMYGEQPTVWKIKMICDQWGTPYKPGDPVSWETKGPIVFRGKKLNNRQIKDMIRRGERSKLYVTHSYTIDKDGCITCGFTDAVYLLNNFGVHYGSGVALTDKREKSREKIKRQDGTEEYLHNWRCVEVLPADETIGSEDDTKVTAPKRRGRKPTVKKIETPTTEE